MHITGKEAQSAVNPPIVIIIARLHHLGQCRNDQEAALALEATWQGIDTALAANDMLGAAVIAEAMLARGERHPMLLNLAAWRKEEAGEFASAHILLAEAQTLAPNDPLIQLSVGAVMRKEGRLNEALATFAKVAPLVADNPAYWLERGYAYEASGALEAAAADFEKSVALDPNSAPPLAALASVLARLGRIEAACMAAKRACALDRYNPTALIAEARCDLEAGAFASARDRLITLTTRTDVHIADRVIALGLLGDAHDRLGNSAEAFAAYAAAYTSFRVQHAARFGPERKEPPQSAFIASIGAALSNINPDLWGVSVACPAQARGHVFLLGYPRSGTTLVENILASAEGVEALEERPTLIDVDRVFLENEGGLAHLAALNQAETQPYVDAYWAQVARFGITPAAKLFVDMDPLKGIKLPLIAKLFPSARIIIMRRDPRDVVWSCFRTNFALSAAAWEFTTLEATAHHYDALMRLTEQCLATLPLTVHQLYYDALVSDFDTTTQALCKFLDLEWSPALRAFDKTAQRRGVATASSGQVRKGLYDGTQQWRRYAAQMESVLPILQPWVERFGFDQG